MISIPNPFIPQDPVEKMRQVNNDYEYYLMQLALFEHPNFYTMDDGAKPIVIEEIKQILSTPREVPPALTPQHEDPNKAIYEVREPENTDKLNEPLVFKLDSVTYKKLNLYGLAVKSLNNGRRYLLTSVDDPHKLSDVPHWRNATVSVREEGQNYVIILNVPDVNTDTMKVPKRKPIIPVIKQQ